MAATVTRAELRDRVRFEADMQGSTRATDADINTLINVHTAEFWGWLAKAAPDEYLVTTSSITTVAGTLSYALPADFRSLVGVYVLSGTRRRPVYQLRRGTISNYDNPQSVVSVELRYVPTPYRFSTDSDPVTGTLNFISGWDELVVQLVARALKRRDDLDISGNDQAIAEKRAEILSQARDVKADGPRYIHDVESGEGTSWRWGAATIDAWALRPGYIDLYQGAVEPI